MAHRRSSIKKIRIDKRRRVRNVVVISTLKTAARRLHESFLAKKFQDAQKQARLYFSSLDKAVKKGVIPKKRASRRKSRIALRLNALKPAA